ncbi:hypothetical protein PVNG_03829 [Plasmodium vivax North Korean]|uniref:Uncharacterized protein n=1 Tax=Plasmodium vivax North Korean TaxID=1035514 RepID=A0A0J9TSU3_PLAVI|nr:hypothetical protein PVNG_03829 [Plasmodium vivax North Korean]
MKYSPVNVKENTYYLSIIFMVLIMYLHSLEYKKYKEMTVELNRTSSKENVDTCNDIVTTFTEGRSNIIEHFKLIKKYFKHYNTNGTHDNSKWCLYINFWLNNKIRTEEKQLNKNTFHLYQKFINCDDEIKIITKCKSSDIYYFDEKIFDQVKKIYDLYDDYMVFDAYKNSTTYSIPCLYAKRCTENFNSIIGTGVHRNNNHLSNVLQDIKHLFEKNGLTSFKKCEKNIPELLPITNELVVESSQSITPSRSINLTPILPATLGIVLFSFFMYKVK